MLTKLDVLSHATKPILLGLHMRSETAAVRLAFGDLMYDVIACAGLYLKSRMANKIDPGVCSCCGCSARPTDGDSGHSKNDHLKIKLSVWQSIACDCIILHHSRPLKLRIGLIIGSEISPVLDVAAASSLSRLTVSPVCIRSLL